MTYTHKLARRLALLHPYAVVGCLVLTAACTESTADTIGPDSPQSEQLDSKRKRRTPQLQRIVLTPSTTTLQPGATQQFAASGLMSDGTKSAVSVTYSATGGTISSGGLYTAGQTSGSYRVIAVQTGGTKADTSQVTISTTTPAPTPTSCSNFGYTRRVPVATATQLASALSNARPGDLIQLADGVYNGQFKIYTSGTSTSRIVLCGTRKAILSGGTLSSGNGIFLRASYWTLAGFSITNSQVGVAIYGGSYDVLDGLAVYGVGQAGVHMHVLATRNTVRNNHIYDTGKYIAEYGEGIYVGSYNGQWCQYTGCNPDRSDYNTIVGNTIGPNVRSDLIDIKEGTTGTLVEGNSLNGLGQAMPRAWNNVWVVVQGNGATFRNNKAVDAPVHGFWVTTTSGYAGQWGNNNVFEYNAADVQASGYGFKIDAGTSGNRVRCTNTVVNAGSGFANVACS